MGVVTIRRFSYGGKLASLLVEGRGGEGRGGEGRGGVGGMVGPAGIPYRLNWSGSETETAYMSDGFIMLREHIIIHITSRSPHEVPWVSFRLPPPNLPGRMLQTSIEVSFPCPVLG